MNTHGHRHVAESVGEPRLRQAFEELGVKNVNLSAFYLGNWLTDMSQVNDPVAGCAGKLTSEVGEALRKNLGLLVAKYKSFITNELNKLIGDKLKSSASQGKGKDPSPLVPGTRQFDPAILKPLLTKAEEYVNELSKNYTALAALLKQPPQKKPDGETTGNSFGDILLLLVKFAAYSKFAHKDPRQGKPGIPYRIFDLLFKSICIQYYPHEHLDRPECQYSYGASCAEDWGQDIQIKYRDRLFSNRIGEQGTSLTSKERAIYKFLTDDITIAAALLCEVDKEWASVILTTESDLQNNEDFHLGLAKFGHCLHAVEDFFAHSNFIEHAAMLNGEQYIKDALYDKELTKRAVPGTPAHADSLQVVKSDKAAVKVRKRLKRFAPDVDKREAINGWSGVMDESSVVTGYFDCHDTLISLSHVLEEVLGIGEQIRIKNIKDIISQYGQKYLEDRLDEFQVEDFAKIVQGDTVEARARRLLLTLLDYFTDIAKSRLESGQDLTIQEVLSTLTSSKSIETILHDNLFSEYPQEILRDLARIIVRLCTYSVDVARLGVNTYQLTKTVVEFSEDPLAFLMEPLTAPAFNAKFEAGVIYDLFLKDTLDKFRYDIKEGFNELVGAYRIGSHSLLAKDYENEPLYPQMFNCAKTLHYYIVDTMCRWGNSTWSDMAKEDTRWIDWKELLSYFLHHPATYSEETVKSYYQSVMVAYDQHIVRADGETFRSIYETFRQESKFGYRAYSYELLLEANLKHVDVSQLLRKDPVAGFPLDESNLGEIVVRNKMGSRLANGSYELSKGLFIIIPFAHVEKREKIGKGVWYQDVMDLTDEQWVDFVNDYSLEKTQLSFPAYQYHKWKYFEKQASGGKNAVQQRDTFIDKTTKLRKALEAAYQAKDE